MKTLPQNISVGQKIRFVQGSNGPVVLQVTGIKNDRHNPEMVSISGTTISPAHMVENSFTRWQTLPFERDIEIEVVR